MRASRCLLSVALCVSSLVSVLGWSPVSAEVMPVPPIESVAVPDRIDPGESRLEAAEPPPFVAREVRVPEPVSARVTARPGAAVAVDGLPVTVRVVGGDAPVALSLESLAADDVGQLGGEVFAFGIEPTTVSSVRVEVSIDYSQFRYALGADWAQRLQLVKWTCDVSTAKVGPEGCGNPIPLTDVTNDLAAGVLTAMVDLGFKIGSGSGESRPLVLVGNGSVLGLASSAGSFQATSLSTAGDWQVGGNNGSFSYDSPIPVPPAFNGVGPSVSLSYDSSAVDGVSGGPSYTGVATRSNLVSVQHV